VSFAPTPARDPLRRSLPADLAACLAPLGAPFRFETNDAGILELCRRDYGRYEPATTSGGLSAYTVRLLVDPSFDEAPPWPEPVFRGRGELFYVAVGRQSVAVADLARGSAAGFLAPALARDRALVGRTFLDCLVLTLLTHGSAACRSYVHAAAVARDGGGILLSGPSGSGKSTLALACLRRGFDLVADDVVYVEDGPELRAWGKPWRLRFLPEAVAHFPELASVPDVRGDGEDSLELEVESLFPGRVRPRCDPRAVVFLERSSGRPRLVEVGRERAIALLARDLLDDAPAVLERHARAWRRLVERGAYRLESGDHPESAAELLERHVARGRG
jgi:hypothetical protein